MAIFETKTCEICGREFTPKTGRAMYCSKECSREAMRVLRKPWRTDKPKARPKGDPVTSQLTKDAMAAHKKGLSYGRYMALVKDGKRREARWNLHFNALKRSIEEGKHDTARSNT